MRGNSSVLSRSQRRQASRQGLLTVLLLIVVAAASFLGGFAAGRWSAPAAEVAVPAPLPRIAVTRPSPAPATAPLASAPAAVAIPEGSPAAPAAPPPLPKEEELTYYNTLTKGEPPPLGSGINLPPPGAPVPTAAGKTAPPVSAGTKEKAPAAAATPAPAAVAAAKSAAGRKTVAGAGSFVVQTASFRKVEDAEALKKRLAKRNLSAFVEAIEVAGKGIWHRVMLGPYATAAEAEAAAAQIKGYERMTPVVKKR